MRKLEEMTSELENAHETEVAQLRHTIAADYQGMSWKSLNITLKC